MSGIANWHMQKFFADTSTLLLKLGLLANYIQAQASSAEILPALLLPSVIVLKWDLKNQFTPLLLLIKLLFSRILQVSSELLVSIENLYLCT